MNRGTWRLLLAIFAPIAVVFCLGLIFRLRAPVLVVTDDVFDGIYGARRLRIKQAESSLLLFRRVKNLRIADAAGAEVVAFAVESAASKPYCVLFPYRYMAGALRYMEQFPSVPVLVFTGRIQGTAAQEGAILIGAAVETDYYHAGRVSAVFAEGSDGEILFFHDGSLNSKGQEFFSRGLLDAGWAGTPRYLVDGAESYMAKAPACVVVAGNAEQALSRYPETPAILFSWLDPALSPWMVKVVFDDSPWALAARAVRRLSRGEFPAEGLSSDSRVLSRRIPDRDIPRKLRRALRSSRSG